MSPVTVADAGEMVTVLGDPRLHEFIGGAPASRDELRDRYRRLVGGSGDPAEEWLNWIVRITDAGTAIGTLQATMLDGFGRALAGACGLGDRRPVAGQGICSRSRVRPG